MIWAAINRFRSWGGVYLFATCLAFFAGTGLSVSGGFSFGPSKAQAGIPSGWESYLQRPDILTIEPQARASDEAWSKLKAAHFAFVAQLLEMYPKNTEFYFLARDSEHLYDVARLVTGNTSEASRIHLLNVSRANMRDPNLKEYLSENGISEATLRQGKQVLFIDTGFSGTIPEVISHKFPNEIRENLKTHLVVSSNPNHPSSRAFLVHLNPSVNSQSPGGMHGTIVSYEHMPRYTDRSSRYVRSGERLHPISPIGGSIDGSVSKTESLKYLADLRAEWNKSARQKWFLDQREKLQTMKSLLSDNSANAKAAIQEELNRLEKTEEGRLFEAYLRDAIEMKTNASLSIQYSLEDFGLKAQAKYSDGSTQSKKAELIAKYPEWKTILEDPVTEIPKLFQQKNWQMIGNLLDASIDAEINGILLNNLYDAPADGAKRSLQISTIKKADQGTLQSLANNTFSKPHAAEMRDLIKMVIEKAEQGTLLLLVMSTFSQPHTAEMKDLIKMVIEKGNQVILQRLANNTFSKPHAAEMRDLIKMMIEKADQGTLQWLVQNTFSQPHIKGAEFEILKMAVAREFASPEERKKWMNQELSKIGSPLGEDLSALKEISLSLKPGDQIEIKKRKLIVVKAADSGRRGIVFQVKAENGALYALKVAKDQSTETLASLAQESVKAKAWQELKIPHAKVLVQEKTFVLKPWINGMSGEEVVQKFASGDPAMKRAAQEVIQLVSKIRNQGAYIGDFRPANLIWNGKAWVIIDSGSIQKGMTLEEAQAKWNAADERGPKFERRWQIKPPQLPRTCREIFAAA